MATAVFWFFAAVAVLSAALCILQRSPVNAALWLVSTMFSLAVIYVVLGAQFIAAIQVLVYAGAVMVLFLFVIMLLNLDRAGSDIRGPGAVTTTIVVVGVLVGELIALWRYTPHRLAAELAQAVPFSDPNVVFAAGDIARQESQVRGVVGGIAAPLFQVYLVPFEITSVLLLAAIIGAVVLAKRKA
jgi:NADH-quinone oxidoreductase subunit J